MHWEGIGDPTPPRGIVLVKQKEFDIYRRLTRRRWRVDRGGMLPREGSIPPTKHFISKSVTSAWNGRV